MGRMAAETTEGHMTVAWSSIGTWQALKLNLQIEAEEVSSESGTVVIITPTDESGAVLTVESGGKSIKLAWVPERNAVRWDTDREYGFDKISDNLSLLARQIIRRVR